MGVFSFTVHDTKFMYALLKQSYFLVKKIRDYKTAVLGEYFPQIDTRWADIKSILQCGVSSRIIWTGMSMTKSDTVPDDTRTAPAQDINANTVRLMYAKAQSLGLTLSSQFEFYDEQNRFHEALQTWDAACKTLIDIQGWLQELCLYQVMAAEVEGGISALERSPAQMIMFDQADIPLADGGKWYGQFYWQGLRAGFGAFYWNLIYLTPEALTAISPPEIDTRTFVVTVAGVDDPENPGVKTIYTVEVPDEEYSLAGLIVMEEVFEGTATYNFTYVDADHGVQVVSLPVAEAPANLTFRILGVKAV